MQMYTPKNITPDERLALISALAEAQGLSDCEITDADIEDFCRATGWGRFDREGNLVDPKLIYSWAE
jgi:hypothetical protein